jgi:hypothetical protein
MKFPIVPSNRPCVLCKQHDAKFTFRGRVKRDRQHDLCHRCYRSLRDSNLAQQLLNATPGASAGGENTVYRHFLELPQG